MNTENNDTRLIENHLLISFKICSNCRKEKDLSEFRNCSHGSGKKMCYCKVCQNAINRAHYVKTRDKRIYQITKWNSENNKKTLKYKKKSYKKSKNI